jgi:hypothetical protein
MIVDDLYRKIETSKIDGFLIYVNFLQEALTVRKHIVNNRIGDTLEEEIKSIDIIINVFVERIKIENDRMNTSDDIVKQLFKKEE